MPKYIPYDPLKSPKFAEISTFMRLPYIKTTQDVDAILCGIPFDTTSTVRTGSREGPQAIRKESRLLRWYNQIQKISLFDHISAVDWGDCTVIPSATEETYRRVEEEMVPMFQSGAVPISMGGDHSVTHPALRAAAKVQGPLSVIHFDSHTDTYEAYFDIVKLNHGTQFRRGVEEGIIDPHHSIQVGIRGSIYPQSVGKSEELGYAVIYGPEIFEMGIPAVLEAIHQRVGSRKAFVSLDIDVVDNAQAPGNGAPEIEGLTSREMCTLVRGLKGLNVIGYDLVEVHPCYDPAGVTAYLAANLIFEFLSLVALRKRDGARPA